MREKLNFGGPTLFVVKVRDLQNLTVVLREVRLGSSKWSGAFDDLRTDLHESVWLGGGGGGGAKAKKGKFPGECLLRLGVSFYLGMEAGGQLAGDGALRDFFKFTNSFSVLIMDKGGGVILNKETCAIGDMIQSSNLTNGDPYEKDNRPRP